MHTDVYALKRRGLEVSCVNISCGYYKPHTDHEYTVLRDLAKCYRLVRHIVRSHKEVSRHRPSPGQRFMAGYYGLFGQMGYDGEFLTCHRENSLQQVRSGRFRTEEGGKNRQDSISGPRAYRAYRNPEKSREDSMRGPFRDFWGIDLI